MSADLTPDDMEFGRNVAASSKDNFMAWMVEQLEPLRLQFNWSDEEMDVIADLLVTARDMAIDDVLAAMADVRGMKSGGSD